MKKFFMHTWLYEHITLHQKRKERSKISFNLCAHSHLHIGIHVLTSNVGKIAVMQVCGSSCKDMSDIQIASWNCFIVTHCNIIWVSWDILEQNLSCRKNRHRKPLSEWQHFFGCTPSSLRHFLLPFSSTSFLLPEWHTFWIALNRIFQICRWF